MAAMTITKEHYIAVAHRLLNHPGKCKNLHGHNYKIVYYLYAKSFSGRGEEANSGMILDYYLVKEKVLRLIEALFDHTTILQDIDPLANILEQAGVAVQKIPTRPTAENMAGIIINLVNSKCLAEFNGGIQCSRVEVWETPTSMAYCEQTHINEFINKEECCHEA